METKPLQQLIQELDPHFQAEVQHFVEFLLTKQQQQTSRRLRQDWVQRVPASTMTALELQHQASLWRSE